MLKLSEILFYYLLDIYIHIVKLDDDTIAGTIWTKFTPIAVNGKCTNNFFKVHWIPMIFCII